MNIIEATELFQKKGANIYPLVEIDRKLNQTEFELISTLDGGIVTSNEDAALDASRRGIAPSDIFFTISNKEQDVLASLFGQCRYLANTKEDIKLIDSVVESLVPMGHLETIGIRFMPEANGENIFSDLTIPDCYRWIRFSKALAVRSIFIKFPKAADYPAASREYFSLIKKIRSDMPCLFSSFCFEGLEEALGGHDDELNKSLHMLSSLNDTSLYSKFYIL